MMVFVIGGTGFVGSHVVNTLLDTGHKVRVLVRPGAENKLKRPNDVEIANGDVTETADLARGIEGCDAAIHLVGIIRAFPGKGITFERLHNEATANLIFLVVGLTLVFALAIAILAGAVLGGPGG